MNRAEEIFKAWRTAFNPNEAQKELASLRMDICNGCEHKQVIAITRCGLCGCPLAGKNAEELDNIADKQSMQTFWQIFLFRMVFLS